MWRTLGLALAAITVCASVRPLPAFAAEPLTAAQLEFFEMRIRPVLIERCYECHNSSKMAEGEFAADSREAFLKGGASGQLIVPGKPAESRLLPILRHEVEGVKMPQGSGKLDPQVIADFEKWIAMGAPDPRDQAPSEEELTKETSWETTLAKRKKWWSFQPIRAIPAPDVPDNKWSDHPVDRFVLAKLRQQQLEPQYALLYVSISVPACRESDRLAVRARSVRCGSGTRLTRLSGSSSRS